MIFPKNPRALRETREEQTLILVTRQLTRRLQQEISEDMRSRLADLPLPTLEDLSEALLDFNNLDDLENWLTQHS